MREPDGLTDALDPTWDAVLVQTFKALTVERDHSHLTLAVQPQLLAAGAPATRFNNANSHIPDPRETVSAKHFQDAMLGLAGFVHREMLKTFGKPDILEQAISRRLPKLHKRALRDGKTFSVLDGAQQHGARKRMKRLRS